ncbi:MAG: glycosyltransferase [Candidatus Competibacteraceae bacterium]|nr:glycosyltransferase [Candidatus Competibacteraceae bacterium]
MTKIPISYACFANHSGYAQAAHDILLAIDQTQKYDLRAHFLFNRNLPLTGMTKERHSKLSSLACKPLTDNHVTVYHCIPATQKQIKRTKRTIGFAIFETFDPPNEGPTSWVKALNLNDAVICPSKFNVSVFSNAGVVKPIFYVPHCVDFDLYSPETLPIRKHERFTFMFFGTWKLRKGYAQLAEAFLQEFGAEDNVQLLIKTNLPENAKTYFQTMNRNLGLEKKETAPILVERTIFDERSLPRFMKSADCLVSPTLGEGFGLPGLQCMALGVPVIVTDFSGCQEYANEQTATLLKPEGFIQHRQLDNLPQFINKKWAFVTVSSIRRAMRYAYENQDEIKNKAETAYAYVRERFSPEHAASAFDEAVRSVTDD